VLQVTKSSPSSAGRSGFMRVALMSGKEAAGVKPRSVQSVGSGRFLQTIFALNLFDVFFVLEKNFLKCRLCQTKP